MSNKTLGEFIKHLRVSQNISTSEIAKNLTISQAEYIKYENGEVSIYIDDLFMIAYILDVSIQELLNVYCE